jgi:rhodanese-related sulfurtransferase
MNNKCKDHTHTRLHRMIATVLIALLALTVLGAGCTATASTTAREPVFKNVTVQEASDLVDKRNGQPDFVILDVRTPEEFSSGHIKDAINIDFYAETFSEQLDKLNKGYAYFVYCRTGHRSGEAMAQMESLGFLEVYNLSGGISDWIASGLPVVK